MGISSRASWFSVSLCLKSEPSLISGCQKCGCSLSAFLHSEAHCSGRDMLQARFHVHIGQDTGGVVTPPLSLSPVFVVHYVFTVNNLILNDVNHCK